MYNFLMMSATANTLLSSWIGFCAGVVAAAAYYGKKYVKNPYHPKSETKVVDIDQSLTESIRYEWRKEKHSN